MKLKKLCSIVAGIRQQQNQRSSFIDGTMIYGFNKAKEDSLRTGELGTCSYVIYFLFFCTRIQRTQIQYLCLTKTQIQQRWRLY